MESHLHFDLHILKQPYKNICQILIRINLVSFNNIKQNYSKFWSEFYWLFWCKVSMVF